MKSKKIVRKRSRSKSKRKFENVFCEMLPHLQVCQINKKPRTSANIVKIGGRKKRKRTKKNLPICILCR
jgi:hypothetical protein